eukprot:2926764-Amphidinium_carterae.1
MKHAPKPDPKPNIFALCQHLPGQTNQTVYGYRKCPETDMFVPARQDDDDDDDDDDAWFKN